jgi:hypothetical protein
MTAGGRCIGFMSVASNTSMTEYVFDCLISGSFERRGLVSVALQRPLKPKSKITIV